MQIENLSKELDSETMTAVRGGDNGNSATNVIGQGMSLSVPVGVLSYGPTNTAVDVTGTQTGTVRNYQDAGDSFLALFPVARELVR